MEYFIGSITTILTGLVVLLLVNKTIRGRAPRSRIFYTQSNIYERIKSSIPYTPVPPIDTQSARHRKSQMIRIVMVEGSAYWIMDSKVFSAQISEDGMVDYGSAEPLDIINMDAVELDKISFIVEKLTEGNSDDSSNTGHQGL
jgi:hypothetical protein